MANYDADEKECRCYLNGELVANFMLHCLDSVEIVGSIMQVNYHDEVEEDNTGEECIRYVLTDNIQSKNFLEVDFNDMNEYEKFYNQLDHSIWNDFEEELRYRISRAQNEPIDDEDWFVMCAMKELVERARTAVAAENKK